MAELKYNDENFDDDFDDFDDYDDRFHQQMKGIAKSGLLKVL